MNKFVSFITPVHNRPDELKRCINSIGDYKTDSKAYEHVIIDDASTEPTMDKHYKEWKKRWPYSITVLRFKERLERVNAFNAGMLQAEGEWIIHLDSDDELKSDFKEVFEEAVKKDPTARIFNWGGDIVWQSGKVTKRPIFRPRMMAHGQCEVFKSGQVFSGGFAFKKTCLNVTGYLPTPSKEEFLSPYAFGRVFLNAYDELKLLYTMKDGELKTDIGNPWGQDFSLMYMLTRHWMPVQIKDYLHITHVRP